MARVRPVRWLPDTSAQRMVCVLAGTAMGWAGLNTPSALSAPRAIPPGVAALDPAPDAAFEIDRTEVVLDPARPIQVIPIRVNATTETDRFADVTSDDTRIVAIERGARVLPGSSRGYVMVRPRSTGETLLRVGSSTVQVRVVPAPGAVAGTASRAVPFSGTPEILTPTSGAGVWGAMRVGAAYWRIPSEPSDAATTVALHVGEGPRAETIAPAWTTGAEDGPLILCAFDVDFGSRDPGPCPMRLVRTDATGREHAGTASVVQVVRPSETTLVQGECEADYGLMAPKVMGPPKAPASSKDDNASGGRFFNNAGADPKFRFPLRVAESEGAGWYQVMLTAAGDAASGALPSIGITIDDGQRPITASAIAAPAWHRIAIGTPFRVEPGFHSIRCDYVNDFGARGVDRNLRLDKIEILRVADDGASTKPAGTSSDAMNAMAGPGGGDAMMSMSAMSASGAGPSAGSWPASARAETRPPVRIALERPIDGLAVAGEMEIRGTLWYEEQRTAPPPQVVLMINGREVQRQRSDAPRFMVPPETLRVGENTVQLRAIMDGGLTAATAPQRITLPQELGLGAGEDHARIARRFTIHDPVWTPELSKNLKENQGGEQRKSAVVGVSTQLVLALPDELAGDFDLWLEARAGNRNERRVEVAVLAGGADAEQCPPRPATAANVPSWFDAHRLTPDAGHPITLPEGPKHLLISVAAPDGSWAAGKGERNALVVQGVRLVERTARTTASVPSVTLDYPRASQTVRDADALVASVLDSNTLEWAEPLIDGKPIRPGLMFDIRRVQNGMGRVIVPLPLRGVSPGPHQVSLRVADQRGKITVSVARMIEVQSERSGGAGEPTEYDRAVMLLDRFAYGPAPRELADLLVMGQDAFLQSRLTDATAADRTDDAARDLAAVRLVNPRSGYDVPRRAIQEAIATGDPVRNRFTLWAENHFSTWVRKDEAWRKWDEHQRFADLGVARFYDLLFASATSPAMLRYLDQERSYGGRLNENYAREIMELHTLGVHGGYSQQDVTNLAHVLTGWTTARTALAALPDATPDEDGLAEDFRYEPILASEIKESRDVVGYRFVAGPKIDRHERVLMALEILSAHPSTARFVCTKLANHYVGVGPAAEDLRLVDDLAAVFTRTGGNMREVLLALSHHPAFWRAAAARRLSHPTDYAFRLARTTNWMNPQEIGGFLDSSGHGLFDRPTPDGYPEVDAEAMDSNAILQRWKLASKADYAIADGVPGAIRWSAEPVDADLRQTIVDILAIRLTGRVLGEASNTQALAMLEAAQPALPARPDDLQRDAQIKTVATFIAQLPEANVR